MRPLSTIHEKMTRPNAASGNSFQLTGTAMLAAQVLARALLLAGPA